MSTNTTTATYTHKRRHQEILKSWVNSVASPDRQQTVMTIAIGSFTLIAISSLFCLFFMVSLLDDVVTVVSPQRLVKFTKRHIDWTGMVDRLSHQLTYFAEWEKQKRAAWYSEDHPIYHEDRFHDLVLAVTTYMNDYVHHRKQNL